MTCVLGIDPGSQITGYGVVEVNGPRFHYFDSGCIRTRVEQSLAERLRTIFEGVGAVIERHHPEQMAIEIVFMHRHADAALKLGQARGVAICAAANAGLTVHEYAPRAIKQAVVGYGAAAKGQVQHMVRALLKLPEAPLADAADALAVALCHAHTLQTQARLPVAAQLLTRRRL
ncbi:MAG: crossover junction endodeoxyribonuclease RuvC [Gammaproteobacteria bacterium]